MPVRGRAAEIWYNLGMLQSRYRLCELFGIPVYVNLSFIVLLLLFVTDRGFGSFSLGLAAGITLGVSVVLHEIGHALAARAFGVRTQSITLSIIGGCAAMQSMPRRALHEFVVAAAGPLVSFLLAGAAYLPLALGAVESMWLALVLVHAFWMNLALGTFNLLPGFPMDGGRIFRSLMRAFMSRVAATLVAMWVGRAFAVLLGLRGLWSMLNGGSWGFISILIAWMIWHEGHREYLLARQETDFRNWSQDDFNARVSPPPYERD